MCICLYQFAKLPVEAIFGHFPRLNVLQISPQYGSRTFYGYPREFTVEDTAAVYQRRLAEGNNTMERR